MIEFEQVWLPQIVSYARLVSTNRLDDEWLGRATPTTSVTDPDELHEQIFDDLDADTVWAKHRQHSNLSPLALAAIDAFLASLRHLNESDPQLLVTSEAWATAKRAAHEVVITVR